MIEAREICKSYNNKVIIENFNIKVDKGSLIAITGESGKGKTTLLNILGLLEKPDKGQVVIEGTINPNKKETMLIQRNLVSYLFQNYALIDNESVEDNLKIALEYKKSINKKEEIKKALEYVNLQGFENRKVYELSGGEQQRVALARAYIKECSYIFADEPTGNLDKKNRDIVFNLLKGMVSSGKAVIFVTHDIELTKIADKVISI